MKLPSRSKLEKELARLKLAVRHLEKNSPSPGDRAPAFLSPFREKCALWACYFRNCFFPGLARSRPGGPPSLSASSPLSHHDFARVIQVVGEEPKFFRWFMHLKNLPADDRIRELSRMSQAMRIDPDNEDLAAILDHLHSPTIYQSFCEALLSEFSTQTVPAT